ncbi:MAG TPA: DUF3891 family protein [Baekduia sp.]|nr:DUF3891 family protein [Baekduia sp.]
MLLRPDGDDAVIAVGQAAHAWVSGQLARAWGGGRFPPPSPREEVCLGAEQHDVGMALWDLEPALDPETGLPAPFYRMDRRTHLTLWEQAPRRLLTQSRYAALLVSLHGTGLYERFPPRTDDPEILAAVDAYLAGQRGLQTRLAAELGAPEDELRRNQALLAAWDDLSLAVCQAALPRTVPDVPSAGGPVAVTAAADGDRGVIVDPWPFAADQVEVRFEGRRLAGRFADARALRDALERAEHVALRLELHPAAR